MSLLNYFDGFKRARLFPLAGIYNFFRRPVDPDKNISDIPET